METLNWKWLGDKEAKKADNEFPREYVNKIINDDCMNVLGKLPDNCVDLIFTSPPYNFGKQYDEYDDKAKWDDYFSMLDKILSECVRVVKHGGRIAINVQPFFSDYIPTHHLISNMLSSKGLIWKAEIIWEKNNYNCPYTCWGSWKSPSSPYFKYTWEFVEVFCKGDIKHKGNKENIDIEADEFKKLVNAKWSVAPETKMKEYGHPAMFPVKLVDQFLKLLTYKNDVVVDPFGGVGTVAVSAIKNSRRFLCCDISSSYCTTAQNRVADAMRETIIV